MLLPALASLTDFGNRLIGGLNAADEARAQACLDDASARIRAECRMSFVDDSNVLALPDGWRADSLVRVCLAAAVRGFQNPQGYDEQPPNASPDIYLTAQEKRDVRRAAQVAELSTITTTRGDADSWDLATQYIEVVDQPNEPIPWLADQVGY